MWVGIGGGGEEDGWIWREMRGEGEEGREIRWVLGSGGEGRMMVKFGPNLEERGLGIVC